MTYEDFIRAKHVVKKHDGFDAEDINPALFDFQKHIVSFMCRTGKAACFADTGLGKTAIQLEWAKQVHRHTSGNVLIVAPLAICRQTSMVEAGKFGIECSYIPDGKAISPVNIINYERLDAVNPEDFAGVALDESSILKSFTGTTKRMLCEKFRNVRFKSCFSATPAPNDFLELGNHSDFLDVMPSPEMIARYFINDTMAAGSYRLKHHAEKSFWEWIASWAICITTPAELGFDGSRYVLPGLHYHRHIIDTSALPPSEGDLFRTADLSATGIHREKNETAGLKSDEIAAMVNNSRERWVIWCDTNLESELLKSKIPDAVEVKGSDSPEKKADNLVAFSNGKIRVIVTKPSIAGYGLNWQNCFNMAFCGLSYSYESFYQAVRRCYRFGQNNPVHVYIFISDAEQSIFSVIEKKQTEHRRMMNEMSHIISSVQNKKVQEIYAPDTRLSGSNYELFNSDCVQHLRKVADGTIDFSIYSPPFSNLYIYSDSPFDMGNSSDDGEFMEHYKYMVQELYRATRPGRLCAIHCKDLPLYKNRDGAAGLRDFPGELINLHESCGWTYHSRITIWKDPVIEMQRTKNHGLLYKSLCQNSAVSRQGMADYIIVMRKNCEVPDAAQENAVKRSTAERFYDYIGNSCYAPAKEEFARGRDRKERERLYSIAVWQRYASPVWFDIQQTNVLNGRIARSDRDEKHICPLQLDVIERCIELWSNPGDLVYSPFAGIGSEGYVALKMHRKFAGTELKKEYFEQANSYLEQAEQEANARELFA